MPKTYYVYITTNVTKTVLYTGVTNNIQRRITEHYLNRGTKETFTGRYNAFYLIHYEMYPSVISAIDREKQIKGWSRKKKIDLIQIDNPELTFLNSSIFDIWPPTDL